MGDVRRNFFCGETRSAVVQSSALPLRWTLNLDVSCASQVVFGTVSRQPVRSLFPRTSDRAAIGRANNGGEVATGSLLVVEVRRSTFRILRLGTLVTRSLLPSFALRSAPTIVVSTATANAPTDRINDANATQYSRFRLYQNPPCRWRSNASMFPTISHSQSAGANAPTDNDLIMKFNPATSCSAPSCEDCRDNCNARCRIDHRSVPNTDRDFRSPD